ncbi:pyrimidine dimer DNA glycosylase/endonuclease V [Billgrantia endophytica]|uniref:DNA lyase n=1 Tax=Billgrantia endophytica TaxID=2033802 RepID=A0A2N7U0V2_9GAMM|nr:pyrimidine dimer DNA glycosylase/endonuclease V [Halomonas endophytica]PMR74051.1 DNA lyase [Halomonas endophytica]
MRLWTLHPRYLDPQGLVALWREALLARAVLCGQTRGYKNHPQLERFREHPLPLLAIDAYLAHVHAEATARGYAFDAGKFEPVGSVEPIAATAGQLGYEWQHMLAKLSTRNPERYEKWRGLGEPECHSLFRVSPGPVAAWERVRG